MLEINIMQKKLKPSYGEQKIVLTCNVEHRLNGYLNSYIVKADVKIYGFNAELQFNEVVERLNSSNQETLTNEAILDLCNDQRS